MSATAVPDPLEEAFVVAYAEAQFPRARPEDREHMLEAARWHIKIGDLSVAPARRMFNAGVFSILPFVRKVRDYSNDPHLVAAALEILGGWDE